MNSNTMRVLRLVLILLAAIWFMSHGFIISGAVMVIIAFFAA